MSRIRPAKVGTQPWLIIFRYNYKIEIGKRIQFREEKDRKWLTGIIDGFNENVIFINLI